MSRSSTLGSHDAKRKPRAILKLLLVLLVTVLFVPVLLGRTSLRDLILNSILDSEKITLSSRSASLGYFSPVSVDQIDIVSTDRKNRVAIKEIVADRSWLRMLFTRPDLGKFRVVNPAVNLIIRQPASATDRTTQTSPAPSPGFLLPNLTAEIVNGALTVRTAPDSPPPINLAGINVELTLERKNNLSILTIPPSLIFDHQALTPEICGQGLQLIAPLLADEVTADGEFSLKLSQCEIPISSAAGNEDKKLTALNLTGQLDLHQARVSMRNTLASNVIAIIMRIAGTSFPDAITVAQDVSVQFMVKNGRLHHSGLAFILPHGEKSIDIVSSGSVGLDETLDLTLEIKLPDGLLGTGVVRDALTREPLVLKVTGTLASPKIRLAGKTGILQSVGNLIDIIGDDPKESGADTVGNAISDILGDVLDIANERKKRRQSPSTDEDTPPPSDENPSGRFPLLPRFNNNQRERRILPRGRIRDPDPDAKSINGTDLPTPDTSGAQPTPI